MTLAASGRPRRQPSGFNGLRLLKPPSHNSWRPSAAIDSCQAYLCQPLVTRTSYNFKGSPNHRILGTPWVSMQTAWTRCLFPRIRKVSLDFKVAGNQVRGLWSGHSCQVGGKSFPRISVKSTPWAHGQANCLGGKAARATDLAKQPTLLSPGETAHTSGKNSVQC